MKAHKPAVHSRKRPEMVGPPGARLPIVETERGGNGARANMAAGSVLSPHMSAMVAAWAKRSRYNPIRALTPEYLARIMDIFENGYLREFALMAYAIRKRDPIVMTAVRKREKSISRHGIDVLTNDGLDGQQKTQAEKHAEALTWFYDHVTARDVMEQDQIGGKRLLIQQMMGAVYYRYACHEIVWRPSIDPVTEEVRLTADFNYVPLYFFEATTGHLRFNRKYFGTIFGEEMEQGEWLVTVSEGIAESIAVCYMYKTLPLKDWLSFSERFGTPGLLGKTKAGYNTPGWVQMAEDLARFAQHWTAVTNVENTIDLIQPSSGTGNNTVFEPLVQEMNKAIVTVCRGADLSTISSGKQMQGRGASLQGDETSLIEQDDAEMITETLHQVDKLVIDRVFPGEAPLAYSKISVPDVKTVADTIARVNAVLSWGVEVGADWARNELGVPKPDPKDELLTAPVPTGPFGSGDETKGNPEDSAAKKIEEGGETDEAKMPNVGGLTPILAKLDNRAAGKLAVFRAHALVQLADAQKKVLEPITTLLANAVAIEDDAQRHAALVKIQAAIPALFKRISGNPALSNALEEIYAAALTSAGIEAAAARSQLPGKRKTTTQP